MRPFGFSTGALAPGHFDQALKMLDGITVEAIELSALRIRELPDLLEFASHADLSRFSHISVHAPTDYQDDQEAAVVRQLTAFSEKGWPIVAPPGCDPRLYTLEAVRVVPLHREHGQTQASRADGRGIEARL